MTTQRRGEVTSPVVECIIYSEVYYITLSRDSEIIPTRTRRERFEKHIEVSNGNRASHAYVFKCGLEPICR